METHPSRLLLMLSSAFLLEQNPHAKNSISTSLGIFMSAAQPLEHLATTADDRHLDRSERAHADAKLSSHDTATVRRVAQDPSPSVHRRARSLGRRVSCSSMCACSRRIDAPNAHTGPRHTCAGANPGIRIARAEQMGRVVDGPDHRKAQGGFRLAGNR